MGTFCIGKNRLFITHTSSTNTYAMSLLSNSKPLPEGTVIMAEHQSGGRGQLGNTWESEARKNITISIILNPTFLDPGIQFFLSKAVSLGVSDAVNLLAGINTKVKWPNDIYYNNYKLAGILIENLVLGNVIKTSIVGIGLNVNQEMFFSNAPNPVSLKNITGKEYDLIAVLNQVCACIETRYLQLKSGKYNFTDQEYLNRLFQREVYAAYKTKQGLVYGTIMGVTKEGKLQVLLNQSFEEFDAHDIQFVL